MGKAIVLQAVDSPRRDMEWRIYMAAKLAERGISSIIGTKAAIRSIHARSKNCIILGRLDSNTGRTSADRNYLREMESKGTSFFFLHDEGGLYYKGEYEEYVKRIYPEDYFGSNAVKKIFFWGERQERIFDYSDKKDKFVVTGFPRFDLCKPCYKTLDRLSVKKLKAKYGNYVLICGRFAAANMVADDPSALGKRSYDMRVEGGSLKEREREEVLRSMFRSWEKVSLEFSHFVSAVAQLAIDFPHLNFVVRPHPSEKESFYSDAFCHFDNIYIDKEGDVRPFIRASKAIIHSECTTGIEAEIARVPNVNFRPLADDPMYKAFEVAGASEVGTIAKNYQELYSSLKLLIDWDFKFTRSRFDGSSLLLNHKEEVMCADLICLHIEQHFKNENQVSVILKPHKSLGFLKHFGLLKIKTSAKQVLSILGWKTYKVFAAMAGDLKNYEYSDSHLKRIWNSLAASKGVMKVKDGVVYVCPK